MFDLDFYIAVDGFFTYHMKIKQIPLKFLPKRGNRTTVADMLRKTEEEHHIRYTNAYFNYYMKKYFEYFNINFEPCHT